MSSYELSYGNLVFSFIITILAYMIVPIMLRLTNESKYEKKRANKIAIINSIIVSLVFFIIREITGDVENNSIAFAPAFIYYGINLSLLQWNLKERDYTYFFMLFSGISILCGWFLSALLFGFVAFILAYGGLKISRKKDSLQRKIFYVESFFGLFVLFSYLHSITLNIGILYVWGVIYSTVCMFILHFTVLKKQVYDEDDFYDEIEEKNKKIKKVYCRVCGGLLNENKKCKKCGKQYFKFNYKVLSIILVIVIIILSVLCIYFYCLYDKSIKIYSEYVVDNISDKIDLQEEIESINGDRTTYWTKEKLDFFDENIVFVIEGYGDYYYSYDCMIDNVEGEYSYWAYNKEQAISRGYQKGRCN